MEYILIVLTFVDLPEFASSCNDLSLCAVLTGKLDLAMTAAKKCIKIDPGLDVVQSNLTLIYLFNYDWADAEKIYSAYKDRALNGKSWKAVFIQDTDDLRVRELVSPEDGKVRRLLADQGRP